MNKSTILSDYMPAGDIVVVSICMVMMVLLFFSYTRITKSLKLFMTTVGLLALSALSNVAYHMIAATMPNSLGLAYAIRCAHHALLYSVFLLFIFYICEAARLEKAQRKPFTVAATLLLLIVVVLDIASSIQSVTSPAGQSLRLLRRETVFMAGYIAYVALIAVLLSKVRSRM